MNAAAMGGEYLAALLAGDRRRAFAVVETARAEGMGVADLYLQVFQPSLREIGRLWQGNRISVAVEHLATGITEAAMARVYADIFESSREDGPTLLAGCAETERHTIGLRMVCDLLELAGWKAVFLGASVPTASLARMAAELRPDAVALSASISPHVPQLKAAIQSVRHALGEHPVVIAVGGRPFLDNPALAGRIGADLTAADAQQLSTRLQERFH